MPKRECHDPAGKWVIVCEGQMVGYPSPLRFTTAKDAKRRANRIRHQSGLDVTVERRMM